MANPATINKVKINIFLIINQNSNLEDFLYLLCVNKKIIPFFKTCLSIKANVAEEKIKICEHSSQMKKKLKVYQNLWN